jgi:mono/diheme cytochrome c family protein
MRTALIAFAFICAAAGPPAQAQQNLAGAATRGDAAAGGQLYERAGCWTCHGRAGQGEVTTGPPLAGRPYEAQAFVSFLRRPYGVMPPYTERVLSDEEALDIMAYLKTLRTPERR